MGCPMSHRMTHYLFDFFVLQCIRCYLSICIVDMACQNVAFDFLPKCFVYPQIGR